LLNDYNKIKGFKNSFFPLVNEDRTNPSPCYLGYSTKKKLIQKIIIRFLLVLQMI